MNSRRLATVGIAACTLGLAAGCARTQPTRAHAEMSNPSGVIWNNGAFIVGDTLGARMVRAADREQTDAPIFARGEGATFEVADALGAATMRSPRTAYADASDDR